MSNGKGDNGTENRAFSDFNNNIFTQKKIIISNPLLATYIVLFDSICYDKKESVN